MSPIGPELPPHLLTQNDGDNNGEPAVVGPEIPPELLNQQKPSQNDGEDSDEDSYAPELPPDMAVGRVQTVGPSMSHDGASSSKRQVGPSFPSYAPTYDPQQQNTYSDDDDDDDDDIGPKPLPPGMQHEQPDAVKEFVAKEESRRKQIEEAAKPKAPKRDEWMLVPPSSSDLLAKLDPTKLSKSRQFSRSAAPAKDKVDNSLWTETPAERQQRLADEVSGKKRRAVETANEDADTIAESKRRKREEGNIRRGVEEYTKKLRGPSLIEQHSSQTQQEEDKTTKDNAIWDHSRDMSLGGRLMDDSKRNKLIKEARGLGDRFGTGKSGGFL